MFTTLNISVGHYEKIQKWPPFHKYRSYRKISNYQQIPKVWVSSFLSVDRNRISTSAFMKKLKNGCHFVNINHTEKISNYWLPPKVWVSSFLSVDRNAISASVIMKKMKNSHHFVNIHHMEKCQITDSPPPKVWVSSFLSVNRKGISVSTIMKKFTNGCHFVNIDRMENFQITDPPKFGSPFFWVSKEREYQCWPLWKKWKMTAIL